MTDELKLRKDAERAAQAEELLKHPLLVEAFTELEASYINGWKSTPARDTEAREKLWQAVQIVGKVRTHLEHIAANGAMAKHELAKLTEKPKRFVIV